MNRFEMVGLIAEKALLCALNEEMMTLVMVAIDRIWLRPAAVDVPKRNSSIKHPLESRLISHVDQPEGKLSSLSHSRSFLV